MKEYNMKEYSMKEYQECAEEMMDFIEKSPTCFQAVANLKADLEEWDSGN